MDGKTKKWFKKAQFVKKLHFLGGLLDVTALTFFHIKVCFKKKRNQTLRILTPNADKFISPDSCKRKKSRKNLL